MQESGGGAQQITWRTTSTDEERSEDGVWTSFSTTRRTKVELFSCVNPSYFIFKVQSTWTRDRRTSAVSSTGTNTEQQNQVEPNSTSSVKKCKNRNIFHQTLSFKRNSAELQTTKNPQILWLCFFFVWNKERVNHQRLPVEFTSAETHQTSCSIWTTATREQPAEITSHQSHAEHSVTHLVKLFQLGHTFTFSRSQSNKTWSEVCPSCGRVKQSVTFDLTGVCGGQRVTNSEENLSPTFWTRDQKRRLNSLWTFFVASASDSTTPRATDGKQNHRIVHE